jgi:hypothetical protein
VHRRRAAPGSRAQGGDEARLGGREPEAPEFGQEAQSLEYVPLVVGGEDAGAKCRPGSPYSVRSVTMGSTRAARRAGTRHATAATAASRSAPRSTPVVILRSISGGARPPWLQTRLIRDVDLGKM